MYDRQNIPPLVLDDDGETERFATLDEWPEAPELDAAIERAETELDAFLKGQRALLEGHPRFARHYQTLNETETPVDLDSDDTSAGPGLDLV